VELQPITLKQARLYVDLHHRHHRAPQGGLFAISLANEDEVIGVAIVGRPVSRHLDDGWTAEVTRLCVDGTPNAASKLYAASWRAARAMGYRRLITYVLKSESGTSVRAAGWKELYSTRDRPRGWDTPSRPRLVKAPTEGKTLFEMVVR
jgi:hypothetical protein